MEGYLERVVPAERVAEVVHVLDAYTVEDLLALSDEDILQIVMPLKKYLSFELRFLYRYLQAAGQLHSKVHNDAQPSPLTIVVVPAVRPLRFFQSFFFMDD